MAKANGNDTNSNKNDQQAEQQRQAERGTAISESLANEARELGIEPAGYSSADALQERVDHVRAEHEAVKKDGQADLHAEAADERAAADNGVMTSENTPTASDNK